MGGTYWKKKTIKHGVSKALYFLYELYIVKLFNVMFVCLNMLIMFIFIFANKLFDW